MVLMACIGCAKNFDGVKKFPHQTIVCPFCHSGKLVVRQSHPLGKLSKKGD